jgi:transcriptional regulator with XRE-family HTH domain
VALSPSSSVQRARQQLAERLRDIRLDAGLTARALSAAAGWHEAKTSRIESAKQAPGEADIQQWCRVCGAERETPDLIAASRAADSMYVEWRRLKAYCSAVVPGFLQTPAYAGALLSAIGEFRGTPDDVEEAVAARMSRNRMLRSGNHRLALLVEESVLRHRLGGAEVMTPQLGQLLEATKMPSMSLGVIPFTAGPRPMWPLEAFTIFDDERVHVELLSAQVTVTAPSEITLYVRAFEKLARLAVYRAQARDLIAEALGYLG